MFAMAPVNNFNKLTGSSRQTYVTFYGLWLSSLSGVNTYLFLKIVLMYLTCLCEHVYVYL